MPHTLKNRVLPIVIGAAIVVGGANLTAYAANGHPLLLGHKNSESSTARLSNSGKGPALSLRSGKKSPSLAVSSSKLVRHLNADRVDGENAADLETRAVTWTIPGGGLGQYALDGLESGTYLATLSILLDATTTSRCSLAEPGHPLGALTYGANSEGLSMISGAGILKHQQSKELTLNCDGATSFADETGVANTITLVRLDQVKHEEPRATVRTGGR
jgi:hypothetical protein